MNKQDAIKMLGSLFLVAEVLKVDKEKRKEIKEALNMAIEALQDDWIPVSERLPEKNELVLVTVWNDVITAWRNLCGGWESAEDMYGKGDVTAWKPLPAPYKESDSE